MMAQQAGSTICRLVPNRQGVVRRGLPVLAPLQDITVREADRR